MARAYFCGARYRSGGKYASGFPGGSSKFWVGLQRLFRGNLFNYLKLIGFIGFFKTTLLGGSFLVLTGKAEMMPLKTCKNFAIYDRKW
jgi:hypothetical protein